MRRALVLVLPALLASPAIAAGPGTCGTTAHGALGAVHAHRERVARGGLVRTATAGNTVGREGHIAWVVDEGDLAMPRNPMDLQSMNVRLTPEGSGYSVSRVDQPLQPATGTRLGLGDDDTVAVQMPFAFPVYGQARTDAYVNSDGNVTFGAGDGASTSRDVSRLVGGAPRVAGLLADLDPTAGGSITFAPSADRAVITWTDVPRYGERDQNTFQITLWADGRIDFTYASNVTRTLDEGVVGVAPGGGEGGFTPVDFSNAAAVVAPGAFGESFRNEPSLDTLAVARKFYGAFPDDFDQLVVFTTQKLTERTTFAYQQTVRNEIGGIGVGTFNYSAEYGSGGRLQGFAMMDDLNKYPSDPALRFLDQDSALTLLGHESGHRWLAKATFLDAGRTSSALLGRDDVHWSFFFDSDGSFMEGNDIEELGGGQYRTRGASLGFSALDQYLMGLRSPEEVPPFWYVSGPAGTSSEPGSNPHNGVTFSGTRKDVTIADVIASIGTRSPSVADAPKVWRQGWILVSPGGPPSPEQIAKIEGFRAAWEPYWSASTGGRSVLEARLD